jgi:hypothetical protein
MQVVLREDDRHGFDVLADEIIQNRHGHVCEWMFTKPDTPQGSLCGVPEPENVPARRHSRGNCRLAAPDFGALAKSALVQGIEMPYLLSLL